MMGAEEAFVEALGLKPPWLLERVSFDKKDGELTLWVNFEEKAAWQCPACGASCHAYDSKRKTWRHLDFFQFRTKVYARCPRVECGSCGAVRNVEVPWAQRPGFTLEFESRVMSLASDLPMATLAEHLGETDNRLWRLVSNRVAMAREQLDFSKVTAIGIDETATRRGHNYITLFVDLHSSCVLFATSGKDASTIARFIEDFRRHGGDPAQITDVCIDMSVAYQAGVAEFLPEAEITFDRFHLMKLMSTAIDEVRREEQREHGGLKRTRYWWLKNASNLSASQRRGVEGLSKQYQRMGRAYRLKETFADVWRQHADDMETWLRSWYAWAIRCRIDPIREVAKTVKRHWDGIVQWGISRLANGVLEGINSLVQAAKAKARGYRSDDRMITMSYLVAGNLDYGLPT